MRFKVPQNVDIEDRIVGPLTGKQFLWFLGAGAILFLIYRFVDSSLFFACALFLFGIAAAFAFYRPYNQNLLTFLSHILIYGSKSKQYVWSRKKEQFKPFEPSEQIKKEHTVSIKKQLPENQVEQLAQILDTQGQSGFFKKQEENPSIKAQITSVEVAVPLEENQNQSETQRLAQLRNQNRSLEMRQKEKAQDQLLKATASGLPSAEDQIPDIRRDNRTPSPDPIPPAPANSPNPKNQV
ncbi:MAG: PrgI family protein [Patescibacteria group bacterium]|nr:PrgI family protein [Patescibacteria group bacterium]